MPDSKDAESVQVTDMATTNQRRHRVRIALSVDFDAVSAHLGTGKHPDNNMSDYSQGIFAGKVGALRLLRLFKRLGLAEKMTWFIPGHSMETFPAEVKQIVESGCEIGLHGYSHEVGLCLYLVIPRWEGYSLSAGRIPKFMGKPRCRHRVSFESKSWFPPAK